VRLLWRKVLIPEIAAVGVIIKVVKQTTHGVNYKEEIGEVEEGREEEKERKIRKR
jgi:hypothetical protein